MRGFYLNLKKFIIEGLNGLNGKYLSENTNIKFFGSTTRKIAVSF